MPFTTKVCPKCRKMAPKMAPPWSPPNVRGTGAVRLPCSRKGQSRIQRGSEASAEAALSRECLSYRAKIENQLRVAVRAPKQR